MIKILNGIHETVEYNTIQGVRVYHNREDESYPIHWHIALEIIMPIKNTYTVEINGEVINCYENDILIIAPGELHTLIAPPMGERLIILIDFSVLYELNKIDTLLPLLSPYKLIRYNSSPELSRQLSYYLCQVEEEYVTSYAFANASIQSLLLRLLVIIGRNHLKVNGQSTLLTTSKQAEYIEIFMDICSYINEHCTENITLDDLAFQAGFSKYHFSRLFKQFTGISYYDYLTEQRIAYAERLLLTPSISIADVAMESGFNSLSSFNRIFKMIKKCTPREYKTIGRFTNIS